MHFHTLMSLTLASLALSAPTGDAAAPGVTRAPKKRVNVFLLDQKTGDAFANPDPEFITERGAVEGCFFPGRNFILYNTIVLGCERLGAIQVFPPPPPPPPPRANTTAPIV
jgi:hypothetical protein